MVLLDECLRTSPDRTFAQASAVTSRIRIRETILRNKKKSAPNVKLIKLMNLCLLSEVTTIRHNKDVVVVVVKKDLVSIALHCILILKTKLEAHKKR